MVLEKKDSWRIRDGVWKFSETANIFNTELYIPQYGIIDYNEVGNEGVPCEVFYYIPDGWIDRSDYEDLIVVTGQIIHDEYETLFQRKAFGFDRGKINGNDLFIDWTDYDDLEEEK